MPNIYVVELLGHHWFRRQNITYTNDDLSSIIPQRKNHRNQPILIKLHGA